MLDFTPDLVNQDLMLVINAPLGGPGGAFGYPTITGKVVEILPECIRIRTKTATMFGPPGPIMVRKEVFVAYNQISGLETAASMPPKRVLS